MADQSTAPPRSDPSQKTSTGNAGVYSAPESTDTSQSTTKNRIGVYDRPEGKPGLWSPMMIIALVLGFLFLLWMLGMFDQFIG